MFGCMRLRGLTLPPIFYGVLTETILDSWLPYVFFETCHVEVDRRALMDDGNIMCVLNEVGGASWPCKGSCRVHGTSTEANHFRGRGLCVGQWCTLGRGPRDFQESSQCCIPQAEGATQKEISSVNFLKSVVEWLWFASTSKKSGSSIFPCKSVRVKKKNVRILAMYRKNLYNETAELQFQDLKIKHFPGVFRHLAAWKFHVWQNGPGFWQKSKKLGCGITFKGVSLGCAEKKSDSTPLGSLECKLQSVERSPGSNTNS